MRNATRNFHARSVARWTVRISQFRSGWSTCSVPSSRLAAVGLFADLSSAELIGLAGLMRPRLYARDEVVYLRGDPGTAFYVVASGRVKIALTSPEGKELILSRIGPGGFHGELALLDDE